MRTRSSMLAAVLACLALAPASALGNHVQCGEVITVNTTLDSDVLCEGETGGVTGITIGADGVTLALAGHTVSGQVAYHPRSNAIATDQKRRNVIIKGGTVRGFAVGVNLIASGSVIDRIASMDNGGVGISAEGDDNAVRRSSVLHTAEFGILMRGDRAVLERSAVRGPLGCARLTGDSPRMTRNALTACYWAGGVFGYWTAAFVSRNSVTGNAAGFGMNGRGAVIERNDFSDNEASGLIVNDPEAVVDRNTAHRNALEDPTPPGGIGIVAAGATVSRNRADHNAEYGIYAVPGTIDGGGNRAKQNGNPAQCVGVRCK
jgi:Right handed beta helix region